MAILKVLKNNPEASGYMAITVGLDPGKLLVHIFMGSRRVEFLVEAERFSGLIFDAIVSIAFQG